MKLWNSTFCCHAAWHAKARKEKSTMMKCIVYHNFINVPWDGWMVACVIASHRYSMYIIYYYKIHEYIRMRSMGAGWRLWRGIIALIIQHQEQPTVQYTYANTRAGSETSWLASSSSHHVSEVMSILIKGCACVCSSARAEEPLQYICIKCILHLISLSVDSSELHL